MARRHFLQRKRGRQAKGRATGKPTVTRLLALLESEVIESFSHLSTSEVQAVALAVSEPDDEDPGPNPSHPACAEFASSDYCRESWQLHLARLKRRPETHWGICQHERICAIIPLVCGRRCPAVVKLAGPAVLDKAEFQRLVEMLDLLVRGFAALHADFLSRLSGGVHVETIPEPSAGSRNETADTPVPTHPQVVRSLEYIAAHLSDPSLTVAKVASVLDLYPTYLSELFVEQVGQRMSRFIASRRIETAKRLLITTDWQIKRIALETGHANANWFCHVFNSHTGLSPREFRTTTRNSRCSARHQSTGVV